MSKYKIGDYDYQIPGNPEEQKDWEIGRLRERIAELEKQNDDLVGLISDGKDVKWKFPPR